MCLSSYIPSSATAQNSCVGMAQIEHMPKPSKHSCLLIMPLFLNAKVKAYGTVNSRVLQIVFQTLQGKTIAKRSKKGARLNELLPSKSGIPTVQIDLVGHIEHTVL